VLTRISVARNELSRAAGRGRRLGHRELAEDITAELNRMAERTPSAIANSAIPELDRASAERAS
jgi:hypothetical protein